MDGEQMYQMFGWGKNLIFLDWPSNMVILVAKFHQIEISPAFGQIFGPKFSLDFVGKWLNILFIVFFNDCITIEWQFFLAETSIMNNQIEHHWISYLTYTDTPWMLVNTMVIIPLYIKGWIHSFSS